MTDDENQISIGYGTLGRSSLLDEEAIDRILQSTELELLPSITGVQFKCELNNLLITVIQMNFSTDIRRCKEMFEELRSSFENYQKCTRQLRGGNFFPPIVPEDWRLSVEKWIDDMDCSIEQRGAIKTGRPLNKMKREFYPKILGFFTAVFGAKPTSTTSKDGGLDGPAAKFILAVIKETKEKIDKLGFDAKIYDSDRRAVLAWKVPSSEALAKNIAFGLKFQRNILPDIDPSNILWCDNRDLTKKDWEMWRSFYETPILQDSQIQAGDKTPTYD